MIGTIRWLTPRIGWTLGQFATSVTLTNVNIAVSILVTYAWIIIIIIVATAAVAGWVVIIIIIVIVVGGGVDGVVVVIGVGT